MLIIFIFLTILVPDKKYSQLNCDKIKEKEKKKVCTVRWKNNITKSRVSVSEWIRLSVSEQKSVTTDVRWRPNTHLKCLVFQTLTQCRCIDKTWYNLCDKVCYLRQLVGFSVSAGTLNFSTIKTEPHDIIEMLMKKALGIQKPQSIQWINIKMFLKVVYKVLNTPFWTTQGR